MWTVGCLVVVLLAHANAFDPEKAKEAVTNFRLKSQNLHVDYVASEIEKLEKEFDGLSSAPNEADIVRVKARVRNLEGNKCPKKEVSCGGDWPECVHNLLFCDGVKDCHNGADEDQKLCDGSIVHVGSSFRGIVHWHRCVDAPDHYSTITITAVRRSPFFTSRTFLRASVTRENEDNTLTSYTAHGYFVYASRKLVVIADANAPNRIGVICDFTFGDNDHAACKIVQESSLEECAMARLNRV